MLRSGLRCGMLCLLVLNGCVSPKYVDFKVQQAKLEKFEERLAAVESLSVSMDARVKGLASSLEDMQQQFEQTKVALTQQVREEYQSGVAEITQRLATLEADVAESKQANTLMQQQMVRKPILQETVYFKIGQTNLSPEAQATLDRLGMNLVRQQLRDLEVTGYADQEGSNRHNLALSRQRAETVVEYLIKRFPLDKHSIAIAGLGEAPGRAAGSRPESPKPLQRVEVQAFAQSPSLSQ